MSIRVTYCAHVNQSGHSLSFTVCHQTIRIFPQYDQEKGIALRAATTLYASATPSYYCSRAKRQVKYTDRREIGLLSLPLSFPPFSTMLLFWVVTGKAPRAQIQSSISPG